MKLDNIITRQIDRTIGLTDTIKYRRSSLNGLLVVLTSPRDFQDQDRLGVKLFHEKDSKTVVDRIPMQVLSSICDLNFGYSRHGSGYQALVDAMDDAAVTAANLPSLTAFYIPFGNITLGEAELEITLELPKINGAAAGTKDTLTIFGVQTTLVPDYLLSYETTKDLENNFNLVKQIYLVNNSTEKFLGVDGTFKDVHCQLDVDGQSLTFDLTGLIASTSIFSNVEAPATKALLLFNNSDALPADCHLKVTGDFAPKTYALIVKESMISDLTSKSTLRNLEAIANKTSRFEREYPEMASAYRHAGRIVKAGEMKAALSNLQRRN